MKKLIIIGIVLSILLIGCRTLTEREKKGLDRERERIEEPNPEHYY